MDDMDDFFKQPSQPIDMSEVETPTGVGLPIFVGANRISRVVSTEDIIRCATDFDGKFVAHLCADMKYECTKFDASYMKALGYTKLWFKDVALGDTQISYEMWGEK